MFTQQLKEYLAAMPMIQKVWVNKDGIYHVTPQISDEFSEYTRDAILAPEKEEKPSEKPKKNKD